MDAAAVKHASEIDGMVVLDLIPEPLIEVNRSISSESETESVSAGSQSDPDLSKLFHLDSPLSSDAEDLVPVRIDEDSVLGSPSLPRPEVSGSRDGDDGSSDEGCRQPLSPDLVPKRRVLDRKTRGIPPARLGDMVTHVVNAFVAKPTPKICDSNAYVVV